MGVTAVDKYGAGGNFNLNVFRIAGPSSYAAGGMSLKKEDIGMSGNLVFVNQGYDTTGRYYGIYDYANSKFKIFTELSGEPFSFYSGGDIKGSANTDSENADAAAGVTNGTIVMGYTAVGAGVWAHGALTNPDRARNAVIVVRNNTGGALNLFQGVMTFTVTGTWRGAAQTELITITSSAGNKSIAAGKFRYKYGLKPFSTITNITLDNVPDNALDIACGIGSKIGLPEALRTPTANDVFKITKNAADLSNAGIVDTTYNTVNLGTLADGDDFEINYLSTGAAASEVPATTDLSSFTWYLLGITG